MSKPFNPIPPDLQSPQMEHENIVESLDESRGKWRQIAVTFIVVVALVLIVSLIDWLA